MKAALEEIFMSSWFRPWPGLSQGLAILALSALSSSVAKADDLGRVDVAIVLAVDTSASIGPEQANLQRYGHV